MRVRSRLRCATTGSPGPTPTGWCVAVRPACCRPSSRAPGTLEREAVGAITCGFPATFQRQLAAAVRVPVFTSSLLLVPLVHRMLAPGRRVGILTVNAATLGPEHLLGPGSRPRSRWRSRAWRARGSLPGSCWVTGSSSRRGRRARGARAGRPAAGGPAPYPFAGRAGSRRPGRRARPAARPVTLPRTANVVVTGDGAVGGGIAYHPARRGRATCWCSRATRAAGHHRQGRGRRPDPARDRDRDRLLAGVHRRLRPPGVP